jgi:hypothetical protein
VKENMKSLIRTQAERIAKMQMKKLEKHKRMSKFSLEKDKSNQNKLKSMKGKFLCDW